MKRNSIPILLFFCLSIISCKKENGNSNKEKLISQGPWIISKLEYKTGSGPWFDDVPFWHACKKDDQWEFLANHSYELRQGVLLCDPSSPQLMDDGRWAFKENETKIDIDNSVLTIDKLNEQEFVFSHGVTINGTTDSVKYTLRH